MRSQSHLLIPRGGDRNHDPAHAAQYLKRALDRPVKDAGDYELKEQYEALMQKVGAD